MNNFERIKIKVGHNGADNFRHEDYRVIVKLLEAKKLTDKQIEAIWRLYLDYNYMKS